MTLVDSKYRAFISYSHRDEKWAAWLHSALETYRVPKALVGQTTPFGVVPARLAPIFRDRDELASATDLGQLLTQALRDSACQIVICSPAAALSRWVTEEVLTFKRLGRSDRVLCLIVDGEPYTGAADEAFPKAVRFKVGADGQFEQRARRADRGRRPARQGWQDQRAAQDHRRHARCRARRAEAARAGAPASPDDVGRCGGGRGHDDHFGARHDGLVRSFGSGRAAHPRRGRGRDGATDDELHGGSVQDLRSERVARQHHHGARDSRQGRGARSSSSSRINRRFRRRSWTPWGPFTRALGCIRPPRR